MNQTGESTKSSGVAVCTESCLYLVGGVCTISCAAPILCPAEPAMMARELVDDGEPDTRRMWGWKA